MLIERVQQAIIICIILKCQLFEMHVSMFANCCYCLLVIIIYQPKTLNVSFINKIRQEAKAAYGQNIIQ